MAELYPNFTAGLVIQPHRAWMYNVPTWTHSRRARYDPQDDREGLKYWMGERVVHLQPIGLLSCMIVSLASHTLHRERKGLVMLQPSSCCHGRNLMWPALFVEIAFIVMEYDYVTCLANVNILLPNCNGRWFAFRDCSVTRPFLSLRRVWLARLAWWYGMRQNLQSLGINFQWLLVFFTSYHQACVWFQ